MRLPVRHIASNLIFTTHGTCWAIWRVAAANYDHASSVARERRLAALEGLFKALTGEPMLLSLCPQVDPVAVVQAMVDDVDLEASPRYEALGHRVLDQLGELELTARTDWLAVPLPSTGHLDALKSSFSAARAEMSQQLGLLPAPITTGEVGRRLEQAQRMRAGWPAAVGMRPATEAEILWIYGHSARRGVVEPLLPEAGEAPRRGRGRTVATLGDVLLAEGGTDVASHGRPANPLKRRYLQVSTAWGESYQALMALSEMPEAFVLPGAGYLQQLNDAAFPVDYTVRLAITPGQVAAGKARRRGRELAAQSEEYADDPVGPPASVARNEADNIEFRDRLTETRREVEIRAMVQLAVWGESPDDAQDRANALAASFGADDYTFSRPSGEQQSLWYGMLPGCRTPRALLGYAQYLLARDFAMSMPWCGQSLGDGQGALFGLQYASGGVQPVLVDFARGPREDASASMAFIGELGAGKSVAMKVAVYNILARGHRPGRPGSRGRAVIIDRNREWVRFASACPGTTQVIEIDQHARISLDPLRLYAGEKAARFTESFLTLLLGVRPMDLEGVALSEAVAEVLAAPAPSMRVLVETLTQRGEDDPAAHGLARKLRAVARKDLAAVVFDDQLPIVDTQDADSIVFAVHDLQLPKKSELSSDYRLERLEFEKVLGRSIMYLVAALARETAMFSTEEFAVAVLDECWWLTSSDEGLELLLELVRDGRKRNAAAYVGSHDPYDIGPADTERGAVLRGLFPHRLLFRHTSSHLAERGLEFIGLDPSDAAAVELVTTGLSPLDVPEEERLARAGECLYRHLSARIGMMKILIPADPQAAAAIHTTPSKDRAGAPT